MRKIRAVQFPHNGGEHITDFQPNTQGWSRKKVKNNSYIPCTKGKHRRKFIKNTGKYLTDISGQPIIGEIMCWCEWEQPSYFEPIMYRENTDHKNGLPQYIHTKLEAIESDELRENTDPYIFGEQFYYCVCKQSTNKGNPKVTQKLDKGSIIMFGCHSKGKFILDTLFVVKEYMAYTPDMIHELVENNIVNSTYYQAGLVPVRTYGLMSGTNNKHTLYTGATFEKPIEINGQKIYSFFPCAPYEQGKGFERPVIQFNQEVRKHIPKLKFNDALKQGLAVTELDSENVTYLWRAITKQVIEQGLYLGIWTEEPK